MSVKDNFSPIKPSLLLDFANTKVLDPRITFSRASTAVVYDGKTVAKAEENLLTKSQEFDVLPWTKQGTAAVTANAGAAPDGTTTADRLVWSTASGSSLYYNLSTSLPAGSYTFSVWIKANSGTPGALRLRIYDSNGEVYGSNITPTSSWVRYSVTSTHSGGVWYYASFQADTSNTPDLDVLVWGAQLEQRSVATAYTPTTTQPITNYIPVLQTAAANVARFDHNPVTGESLGLRVEEQRTNLVTYSEQFDNAAWTKSNATIVANTVIAPDGTLTGDLFYPTATSSSCYIYNGWSLASTYDAFTVYAKSAGKDFLVLWRPDLAGAVAWFNLSTGTVASVSLGTASIQSVGNGWYRCNYSSSLAVTNHLMGISVADANASLAITASGNKGIYIWGAQAESSTSSATFPTSYIPTVASQVTRSADSASMTGTNFSSWYRADEGTLYFESDKSPQTSNGRYVQIRGSTDANRIDVFQSGTNVSTFAVVNSVTEASYSHSTVGIAAVKFATAFAVNNFASSINGSSVSTDTSVILPVGLGSLNIGQYVGDNTGYMLNTTIRKLAYYPARLTNTQLQALTQG